ncbi:hypothetical protein GBF38_010875 [Nibea albiflora]|uniref:Uncharacterized protein n=1 Tax=Nibea albiflora TaxID=240163 RepID=A0ACB7ET69_NIBAL|nr:hypothetical protein GBF38_010875 [Nibea albiflora]
MKTASRAQPRSSPPLVQMRRYTPGVYPFLFPSIISSLPQLPPPPSPQRLQIQQPSSSGSTPSPVGFYGRDPQTSGTHLELFNEKLGLPDSLLRARYQSASFSSRQETSTLISSLAKAKRCRYMNDNGLFANLIDTLTTVSSDFITEICPCLELQSWAYSMRTRGGGQAHRPEGV